MKHELTVCERCGLREVRHELERTGKIIRFCDECYWGENTESTPTTGIAAIGRTQVAQPQAKVVRLPGGPSNGPQ